MHVGKTPTYGVCMGPQWCQGEEVACEDVADLRASILGLNHLSQVHTGPYPPLRPIKTGMCSWSFLPLATSRPGLGSLQILCQSWDAHVIGLSRVGGCHGPHTCSGARHD